MSKIILINESVNAKERKLLTNYTGFSDYIEANNNDIIYYQAQIDNKHTTNAPIRLKWQNTDNISEQIVGRNVKGYIFVYSRAWDSAQTGYMGIYDRPNNETTGRNGLIINLTKSYGSGNEPTQSEMIDILSVFSNSYFEGTAEIGEATVTQPKSKWEGKVWNVIGDSLTDSNSHASTKYHDIVRARKEITTNVYGYNGLGYTSLQPGANAIPDKIIHHDKNADLITVFAGENDVAPIVSGATELGVFGDTDRKTYYGSLNYTYSTLVNKYPTKIIAAISQTKHGKTDEKTIRSMVKALKEVCGQYGIPVLDLFNSGNIYAYNNTFKSDMMPDGIHFNNKGNELIADKIGSFIESL